MSGRGEGQCRQGKRQQQRLNLRCHATQSHFKVALTRSIGQPWSTAELNRATAVDPEAPKALAAVKGAKRSAEGVASLLNAVVANIMIIMSRLTRLKVQVLRLNRRLCKIRAW